MSRYCPAGAATGSPGVPADVGVSAADEAAAFARARSADDLAGGSAANVVLMVAKPLTSATAAIVNASASLVMYMVRLPGSGWVLIHCGPPPPLLRSVIAVCAHTLPAMAVVAIAIA